MTVTRPDATAQPSGSTGARDLLLAAAERLIGERGLEVSLREIAVAAGQRNNSAVHYHFGTRDALVEAVVELRQQALEQERLERLVQLDADGGTDLHSLVEVLVAPAFHTPYAMGATHYARFLEKVRDHPALESSALESRQWPATKMLIGRMAKALDDLPPRLVELRLRSMMSAMFALLADAERQLERAGRRPKAAAAAPVVDMLVGMLTAPQAP
ncbi:TetR family transcriptional regulator [Nocardioides sp. CPCC 206347]|uniref:TetR family transcriptional regulator n=1 Tax=Nocardioides sp. CPCC 206347 TaxID=3406463 RepID=UPI003B42D73A